MKRIVFAPGERREVAWAIGTQVRIARRVVKGEVHARAQALLMSREDAFSDEGRRRRLAEAFDLATALIDQAVATSEITSDEAAGLRRAIAERDLVRVLTDVPLLGEAAQARLAKALGRAPIQVRIVEGEADVNIEVRIPRTPPGQANVMFCELVAGTGGADVEVGEIETS